MKDGMAKNLSQSTTETIVLWSLQTLLHAVNVRAFKDQGTPQNMLQIEAQYKFAKALLKDLAAIHCQGKAPLSLELSNLIVAVIDSAHEILHGPKQE